ncbi:MAG: hypothetical protein J6Y78_11535 [Paludibacteraceae bacterium]|nr:hypothetical protein [Paludibacteraceae bacterium]
MCLKKNEIELFSEFILNYISNELRIESVSLKKSELEVCVSSDDEQTMCHEMQITKSLFAQYFDDEYKLDSHCIGGDDEHKIILCSVKISKIEKTNI